MVATACLLGVSTRRVEKLAESLGVTQLSKSQVSAMAKHPDEQVAAFRNRPLDQGPYAFVRVDALTQKVSCLVRCLDLPSGSAVTGACDALPLPPGQLRRGPMGWAVPAAWAFSAGASGWPCCAVPAAFAAPAAACWGR